MKRNRFGFTMIEVLLVAAMLSVLGVAIFHTFANGLKLWSKGEHLIIESDIVIFFDKFGEDLRGVQTISNIPFKGITTQVSFPTVVLTKADEKSTRAKEEVVDQIGEVQYRFDAAEKRIYRRQANYSQALKETWGEAVVAAVSVEDITFRYFFSSDKGLQQKTQTDEGIPSGLMVDVQFLDQGLVRHMRRFFPIPVGGNT